MNCFGDSSELQGLVLGIYHREDDDRGDMRIYTDTAERYNKQLDGKLTDVLKMVPFVILLFVVGAFSSNEVESQCKQDYRRCVSLAEPLLKDPHLIYPDNTNDIESVCRTWTVIDDCRKNYTERCFTEARREEFNKATESLVNSTHKLCSWPNNRNDYLKHATCIKVTLTQDTMCGLHYKHLVSEVSEEAPPSVVCCFHHLLRECVVDYAKLSCYPESAPYASSMLDKALSFLQEQCARFVPSQADCPGADFRMSTSPSMAASNANYSADPTHSERANVRSIVSTTTKSSSPNASTSTKRELWLPSMRPPQVVDDTTDEPQDTGLGASLLPCPVLLVTTALILPARGPVLR